MAPRLPKQALVRIPAHRSEQPDHEGMHMESVGFIEDASKDSVHFILIGFGGRGQGSPALGSQRDPAGPAVVGIRVAAEQPRRDDSVGELASPSDADAQPSGEITDPQTRIRIPCDHVQRLEVRQWQVVISLQSGIDPIPEDDLQPYQIGEPPDSVS